MKSTHLTKADQAQHGRATQGRRVATGMGLLACMSACLLHTPMALGQATKLPDVKAPDLTPRAITVKGDVGIAAVQSGIQNVSASGLSAIQIRYGATGADTALQGQFCTELAVALPNTGVTREIPCDPSSVLGTSLGSNFSSNGRTGREMVSVPPGIAQQAYQWARASGRSQWYFVRQFSSGTYAIQKLRLSSTGSAGLLTLTRVELAFKEGRSNQATAIVPMEGRLPPVVAALDYQGSGLLQGRWEVVQPGDAEPTALDLTPESALTPAQRLSQARYTQVARFDQMVMPGSRINLRAPSAAAWPTAQPGRYLVLLRLESSPTLDRSEAGQTGGAQAGFALPVLSYYVQGQAEASINAEPAQINTAPIEWLAPSTPMAGLAQVRWQPLAQASRYRVEFTGAQGQLIFAARVRGDASQYQLPWAQLGAGAGSDAIKARVMGLDAQGRVVGQSRMVRLRP
jgi:hypothetical protein